MAVAYVNSNGNGGNANSLGITLSLTVGNTAVVVVVLADTTISVSSITDNGNSVYLFRNAINNSTSCRVEIWSTVPGGIVGSPTTITVNLSGTAKFQTYAAQYSGVVSVGTSDAQVGTSTTPTQINRITWANDFVILGMAAAGNTTWTPTTGNLRQWGSTTFGSGDVGGALNDNTTTTNYTNVSNTATIGASAAWAVVSLDLRAASNPAATGLFVQGALGLNHSSSGIVPRGAVFNAAVGAGNLLVAAIYWNAFTQTVSGVADNQGNTWTSAVGPQIDGSSGNVVQIYYAANAKAGATTVTVTFSTSTSTKIFLHEFGGILASPLDKTASANDGGTPSTALNSGWQTTTAAKELIFGAGVALATTTALSVGSGLTALWNPGAPYVDYLTEFKTVSATGSYHTDASAAPADNWSMAMATFQMSVGPYLRLEASIGSVGLEDGSSILLE